MKNPKVHMFICTNQKDGKACCGQETGSTLQSNLKQKLQTLGKWGEIKVTRSGCLGHCENGTVAVIYPKAQWLTKLKVQDEEQLFNNLMELNQENK